MYISQVFHTVIIRDLPQLNLEMKSPVRRFITLMDTLYDNKIRVVISSDVPIKELFVRDKPADILISDEHRMLMDDLKITKDSVSFLFIIKIFYLYISLLFYIFKYIYL